MKVNIKPYKGPGARYAEAVDDLGIKFAILDPDLNVMCSFMSCKDFLQDAFFSELMHEPVSIWGFTWKPGRLKMGAKEYGFAVRYTDSTVKYVPSTLALLNKWDKVFGFKKSKMLQDAENPNLWALLVDAGWTEAPLRISMLTLMVRVGGTYQGEDLKKFVSQSKPKSGLVWYEDWDYVSGIKDTYLKMIETGKFPHQTYEMFKNGGHHGIHHGSGIYAFTTGNPTG